MTEANLREERVQYAPSLFQTGNAVQKKNLVLESFGTIQKKERIVRIKQKNAKLQTNPDKK